jgi:DNA polymerase-3 subunit delta
VAAWKPAYLICGDDHGRIAERRQRLRAGAEAESGVASVEVLEGDPAAPERVVLELSAMTLGFGRRFVIVEGAERWKAADVHEHVAPALEALAPETTVAFVAREDGRAKAPEALHKAVSAAGGEVVEHKLLKAKELPRWAIGEAQRLGLTLDGAAAQTLVTHIGERQQRILRELERLALEYGRGARIGVEEAEQAARSSERQVWGLVDALISGDRRAAFRAYLELRDQGEAVGRLVPLMVKRVQTVHEVSLRLERGHSPQQIKDEIGGNPWAVGHRIAEAQRTDAQALGRALETLAELELQTRGLGDCSEDTAAIRALGRLTTV